MIEKTPITPINGSINLNHLLYVTSTISSVAKISPVGVIKDIHPCPQLYAVTTTALDIPTVSAKGAIMGIDSVASPDDDGTKKPRKLNSII